VKDSTMPEFAVGGGGGAAQDVLGRKAADQCASLFFLRFHGNTAFSY